LGELPGPGSGGNWLADPEHWAHPGPGKLRDSVAAQRPGRKPLAPGPARSRRPGPGWGLPARQLVERLGRRRRWRSGPGYLVLERDGGARARAGPPGPGADGRLRLLTGRTWPAKPFAAPEAAPAARTRAWTTRALAAAAGPGMLLRVADQVVLAPGADQKAARILAGLPGPFTAAEARQVAAHHPGALAIPLLEYLDRRGLTRRLPDDRRTVTGTP